MLRKEPERQQSFYCALYDKIPEDRIILEAILCNLIAQTPAAKRITRQVIWVLADLNIHPNMRMTIQDSMLLEYLSIILEGGMPYEKTSQYKKAYRFRIFSFDFVIKRLLLGSHSTGRDPAMQCA